MTPPVPPPPVPPHPDAPMWLLTAAVAAGGAIGAVCRFAVGLAATARFPQAAWLGTLAVNWAGCLLIGFAVYAAAERGLLSPAVRAVTITGFLGGLTTFSTFGQEAVTLGRGGEGLPVSALHVGLNVIGGLALVWLGRRIGVAALG